MSDTTLRVRAMLDRHFRVLIAGLVVLAALGAGVSYMAHIDPGQVREERVVSTWESTYEFTHHATVTEENSVFEVGNSLRDRPAYFSRISPVLNGTFVFEYDAASADAITINLTVTRVLQSAEEQTAELNESDDIQLTETETIYWAEESRLTTVSAEDVSPGEAVEASFAVNISAVEARLNTIESELGASPGETEVIVQVGVELVGNIDGERIRHRTTVELPIDFAGAVYLVDNPGQQQTNHEKTETVLVPREVGPPQRIGGPILLVLAFSSLLGIGLARYRERFALSDVEREYLQYRDDRLEFDDWIARIDLPEEAFDRPIAQAATLGDLVDYAIDSETAVIEDPETGRYYVVRDDFLYRYQAPALGRESLL